MKIQALFDIFDDNFIGWLMGLQLIRHVVRCNARGCRADMVLEERLDSQDGHRWRCRRCRKSKSLRYGSFFTNSNLSIKEMVLVIYCWAVGMCLSTASTVTGHSKQSLVDWFNLLREECSNKILRTPIADRQLGGPGEIVEIDESLMIKRKYNRGQMRLQHQQWVFGMYERESKIGIIIMVDRRDAATLIPIIQEYVRPGSIIHSDGG